MYGKFVGFPNDKIKKTRKVKHMKALMVRTDSPRESALKAENAVKIARDAGYTAVISADSMNIASVIPCSVPLATTWRLFVVLS